MIKFGTNRICIVGKKFTYKLPLFFRGFRANRNEYNNYINNKDVVAYTEKHWWGLKQETLKDIVVYPYKVHEEDVREEHRHLLPRMVHNRMQIGRDKDGEWKFYDYEEIKYYERHQDKQEECEKEK